MGQHYRTCKQTILRHDFPKQGKRSLRNDFSTVTIRGARVKARRCVRILGIITPARCLFFGTLPLVDMELVFPASSLHSSSDDFLFHISCVKDSVDRARILGNLCCVPETGLALHNCTGLSLSNRFAHYIGVAFGITTLPSSEPFSKETDLFAT